VRRTAWDYASGAPTRRDAEDAAAPDGATRERHAARPDGRAHVGGLRAGDGSILRGTAFMESEVPWAVPITSNASAETKSRTAHRIIRLYRVLRGRAVRRGSAYSASRFFRRTAYRHHAAPVNGKQRCSQPKPCPASGIPAVWCWRLLTPDSLTGNPRSPALRE